MNEDMVRLAQHLLEHMSYGTVQNYIAPGLRSSMVGAGKEGGCVRLFEAERCTDEFPITPHNHQYDFCALVLEGSVTNRMFYREGEQGFRFDRAQKYAIAKHTGNGLGEYEVERSADDPVALFYLDDTPYVAGESYSMSHDEFHSIVFDAGARVLMFEGPKMGNDSYILEPYVEGFGRVATFRNEPWMFRL